MEPQQNNTSLEENFEQKEKKPMSISIPAAIVTGAAIIGLAIILSTGSKTAPIEKQQGATQTGEQKTVAADVATLRPQDFFTGGTNPAVVVIEYSDSDCPFCKQFHETMTSVVSEYKGKVAWAYRFLPLTTLHPNAYTEAVALNCVGELGGQESFWKYMDTVIGITLSPDAKSNESLVTFAVQAGVDKNLFSTCMTSEESSARVDADIEEAKRIGARGTPFSIAVNTKTGKQVVIPGAVPLEYMKETIDSLLK